MLLSAAENQPAVWKPQIAKQGNRAERNKESKRGRERERESTGISSSNRLPERNRPLITLDNRFAKHRETNATSVDG